ncbi:LytTR family DNA-binding domain-containing protein [Chitinophaga sp.]|uniref:LytR/AlgR family response regulator transcription factor n=1 Tax=Chitinophaga sp. TaxID=1869181 RepID=UPI0031D626AA
MGALHYFYINAKDALIEEKIQSGQREIRELGILLEQELLSGTPSAKVIDHLQQSILNTDIQSEFVCMYNTGGIELCHPNPALVGMRIETGNSSFSKAGNTQSFRNLLQNGQPASGIRTFPENMNRSSEIVSVYPVKGTNWMLASHANIKALQTQLDHLYQRFLTGSLLITIVLIGSCFWLIRIIYRKHEKEINIKISDLNDEINNLSIINRQLEVKQKNIVDSTPSKEENTRKRLITYEKDKIITIDTTEIVYIALNENVVSVLTFQGKTYTLNSTLDDLMKELDNVIYYRANRQYIVNINAIESIWIYGRNQLHIETRLKSQEPIIISKNKVSEFKKWLDR